MFRSEDFEICRFQEMLKYRKNCAKLVLKRSDRDLINTEFIREPINVKKGGGRLVTLLLEGDVRELLQRQRFIGWDKEVVFVVLKLEASMNTKLKFIL